MKCSKCSADITGMDSHICAGSAVSGTDAIEKYSALISENEQLKERVKGLESEKRSGWVKWKESEIDEFIKEIGILREDRKNRIAIIFTLEKQLKDANEQLPPFGRCDDCTERVQQAEKRILEEYTKFLCECNYTDDDVWCENPTAIERFIAEKSGREKAK
jgi:vacuolar-type H+-ATPase subunit I/STV1